MNDKKEVDKPKKKILPKQVEPRKETRISRQGKQAAYDIYIDLVSRISTQKLGTNRGLDDAALTSLYNLFVNTRTTLRGCRREPVIQKLAISMLNAVLREFLAKWHGRLNPANSHKFRDELDIVSEKLRGFCEAFALLAGVENLMDETDPKPKL